MAITIMKRIAFNAGHRLMNHGGRCENLHGHNYVAEIFVTAPETDELGRVVDFAVVKGLFKTWIDENWDHAMILAEQDDNAIKAIRSVEPHRLYLLPWNPTAENMARYLLERVAPQLVARVVDYEIVVSKVVMWETETSCAECTLERNDSGAPIAEAWRQSLLDQE
ncbi:MAG: 6-pyruvoyl trahydropterin synthase family protein [Pirellulaceae bacterium]